MFKSFLQLFSGKAIAQALQLVALVFLTSIYLPEDFGKLGKIQNVATLLTLFVTLQLHHVIPLAKTEEIARKMTGIVFQVSILIFVASFGILLFVSLDYIFAIFLSLVLALSNTISGYLIYKGDFSIQSILFIVRAIAIIAFQFILAKIGVSNGLLYGAIIGEFFSFMYLYIKNHDVLRFNFKFDLKVLKGFVSDWPSFSLHGTLQEFLSVGVYSLPILFYVEKFGEAVGGQYSVAFKFIYAPTVLISSSLAKVLYHRFSQEDGFKFLENIFWFDKRLLIPSIIIGLFLFNLNLFDLSFISEEWRGALVLVPWMYLNAIFFLFANPYRVALRILKLNKTILQIEFFTLGAMALLFWLVDVNVLYFTIIITAIGIIQNVAIVVNYKYYENKTT